MKNRINNAKKSRRQKIFVRAVIPKCITFTPSAAVRRALHAAGGSTSDIINAAILFTLAKP